jgi:hypothetical protein
VRITLQHRLRRRLQRRLLAAVRHGASAVRAHLAAAASSAVQRTKARTPLNFARALLHRARAQALCAA